MPFRSLQLFACQHPLDHAHQVQIFESNCFHFLSSPCFRRGLRFPLPRFAAIHR
jgi:hypothetical protein